MEDQSTNHDLWAQLSIDHILSTDARAIQKAFIKHVEYTLAQTREKLTNHSAYQAVALSVRERLIKMSNDTEKYFLQTKAKQVAYLSVEYLIGRSLRNAVYNLGLESNYATAIQDFGYELEDLFDEEMDAGLGNGGLGRLAACFMDSLATLDYHGWGYGLRYKFGIFKQDIVDGFQCEVINDWLSGVNPWEIERSDIVYPVRFYGQVTESKDGQGLIKSSWTGGEVVLAVAYDTPVPGFRTNTTLYIRLWGARPQEELDLSQYNRGAFKEAWTKKERAESITGVLYPNDHSEEGKELRLKQEYLLVSATIQDLMTRFKKWCATDKPDFKRFSDFTTINLNDTHPALAIPELMRLFIDEEGMTWDDTWAIVRQTVAYTNHTVLPEALEKWSVRVMQRVLPRHMKIIYDINYFFMEEVAKFFNHDVLKMRHMSILSEEGIQEVRMANLAIVGAYSVNGVAAIHTDILKANVFPLFNTMWPTKFQNKTNGVTPRRWIHQCNPSLAALLTETLGPEWLIDIQQLERLRALADHPEFQEKWMAVKRINKQRVIDYTRKMMGTDYGMTTNMLFDVHIKRIHEYKRQLLNIFSVMYQYDRIRKMSTCEKTELVPRVVFFAGKAAFAYHMAKLIIKLINNVACVVNSDSTVKDYLKVVFLPNYSVSQAEVVIPGSDLNQQVSTAGMEASGTGNMKFAMNGSLIIGTLDGANIEIRDEIGHENAFIFGAKAEEVEELRVKMRQMNLKIIERIPQTPSLEVLEPSSEEEVVDERFKEVMKMLRMGLFGGASMFEPLLQSLQDSHDYFLVAHDFPSYLEAQAEADKAFKDQQRWAKMSILSTAGTAVFSSDRTIHQYAKDIWGIKPWTQS